MKKLLLLSITLFIGTLTYAQEMVKLEQTPGAFEQKELKLKEGSYIFQVSNKGVDHECGFVIAPKGNTEQAHHIQEAYLSKTIKDGETAKSKEVVLKKGEYVYFCPMNPTPQYTLHVE